MGTVLTNEALALGAIAGVLAMFAAHIWIDYAWLGATAILAGQGRFVLGTRYRLLLVVLSIAMIYFGTSFIVSAIV